MCGIVSIWQRDGGSIRPEIVRTAVASLRHRGPDDEGYSFVSTQTGATIAYLGDGSSPTLTGPHVREASPTVEELGADLAMGHARLSIVDLSDAGHQPMWDADSSLCIVFNGEIYNYRGLRHELEGRGRVFRTQTDTEVVLAAYAYWGAECLTRFNGMWAFALWDARRRELFVARDRFGVKPLVYHLSANLFACASTTSGVLAHGDVPRDIDPEALHHYLSLMTVPWPLTIFPAVKKLPPGNYMVVNAEGAMIRPYWELDPTPREDVAEADAAEHVQALLKESVKLSLVADVAPGAFLSGGVDSSTVCALAAEQLNPTRLSTFGIRFTGDLDRDESHWAAMVANAIGARHSGFELEPDFETVLRRFACSVDEPFASPSVLGVYLLSEEARRTSKVVLVGDGGDEVFAGYSSRYLAIDQQWDQFVRRPMGWLRARTAVNGWPLVRWEPENLPNRLSRRRHWERMSDQEVRDRHYLRHVMVATDQEKRALYSRDWRAQTIGLSTEDWLLHKLGPPRADRLLRWQLFDLRTTLVDEMLAKADKGTMAWGLEARPPLLDHRLVEYVLGVPPSLKTLHGESKYLLKKVAERYIPHGAIYRPKQGFSVPLDDWFRSRLGGCLTAVLDPHELRKCGHFDPAAVGALMRAHNDRSSAAYGHLLFNLVSFQLWHEANAKKT